MGDHLIEQENTGLQVLTVNPPHACEDAEQAKAFAPSSTIKIGKSVYIIERHFSGERDIREAIFEAVKNEAFRAS